MSRHSLDARGLMCPLPVIRTQNRVAELNPGDASLAQPEPEFEFCQRVHW